MTQTLNYSKEKKGKKKKKTKLFKTLCESLSFSQKRKDTHTLKTHAHALLLRKEGDDEGRV